MSFLNISEELLNTVEAEKVSEGTGVLASGVYTVKVEQCFIRKTDSGATMIELAAESKEGKKVFWNTCLKSGDAKGNKATYIDKNGKEQLLPGVIQAIHLFEACGLDLTKEEPSNGKVMHKDVEIEAGIFKSLTGKTFKACVRQYESEYNGEVSIRYDIENFLDLDGKNKDGVAMEDKFLAKIEKSPIKLLAKKSSTPNNNEVAAAASGW